MTHIVDVPAAAAYRSISIAHCSRVTLLMQAIERDVSA